MKLENLKKNVGMAGLELSTGDVTKVLSCFWIFGCAYSCSSGCYESCTDGCTEKCSSSNTKK